MNIFVKTNNGGYDIVLNRGALEQVGELLDLNRKVLIVTDDGVPNIYAKTVAKNCKQPIIQTVKQGEKSKQTDTWCDLLKVMVENEFTRSDCVVAVGGGVIGDLSGFVAATYMRGIDFYNIPTTLLSQVDSSIGGKTAVDFMGYKNLVGAFYPPKKVVIDPDTLKTLPKRQISNGLAESVKMALTSDKKLFEIFEKEDINNENVLDEIIKRSLFIKKYVVENDEHENSLRKILNFGHTLGHAIESINGMENLYHGECVALGMIPMCSQKIKPKLLKVFEKLDLPTAFDGDIKEVISVCKHDKKTNGDKITVVTVNEIGSFEMIDITFEEMMGKVALN